MEPHSYEILETAKLRCQKQLLDQHRDRTELGEPQWNEGLFYILWVVVVLQLYLIANIHLT